MRKLPPYRIYSNMECEAEVETLDGFLICPELRSSTLNYAQVAWKIVGRDSQISTTAQRPLDPMTFMPNCFALCLFARWGEPIPVLCYANSKRHLMKRNYLILQTASRFPPGCILHRSPHK